MTTDLSPGMPFVIGILVDVSRSMRESNRQQWGVGD